MHRESAAPMSPTDHNSGISLTTLASVSIPRYQLTEMFHKCCTLSHCFYSEIHNLHPHPHDHHRSADAHTGDLDFMTAGEWSPNRTAFAAS